ncbi:MAG TPA: circularly permuted type 2 ATP-grasp protein [Pirellulales bacterium]|nr:circularly permuted type 2 ATP-grasp protein [Pirellulales bacterium]
MTTDVTGSSIASGGGMAALYVPRLATHDELRAPDGSVRPHWRQFVTMLDGLSRDEIRSRWDMALRLIRENGITHNIYDNPDGFSRPWNLDLLPLLLPAGEWQQVGEGLVQRARLLNALLADLYGPATSLANAVIPPELVYANRGFLRPCHGYRPPFGQWLHLYAADLVRSSDGRFQVLSDRTQNPSGAGYSLENRIILSRALPSMFEECGVLRLAPFFITMRQTLAALAPSNHENPSIVLLTPGPYNETYFEHAYLARYLGYTLVQGQDLTVRDCRVYLKTLGGLQRVDVILRRVDDNFCDPLELYSQSFLGVPGLLQAIREGTVAVANAMGSGVLQAPAFLPFLPALCRHLLGEELKLPSVPTWWCGNPESLRYVLDNLSRLVIKPALPTRGTDPVFGSELSRSDLEALAGKIQSQPLAYVAQEPVESFMAPVLRNGDVQSRRFVVRAYLAAVDQSYAVMPGALTRVTDAPDSFVVSLQRGGGSKDTWILGQGPVNEVSLLTPASTPVLLSRGGSDLPSRAADDLFWLGRYVQRCEAIVRLARCVINRLTDPHALENPQALHVLIDELLIHSSAMPAHAAQLAAAIFADSDPTGLRRSTEAFRTLARVLRDRISADAWRILEAIERQVTDSNRELRNVGDDAIDTVLDRFNQFMTGFLAFGGMVADSMTRGLAWRFLDMGMRLERAIGVADLLGAVLSQQRYEERFLLDALLEAGDSSLTYRRRYLTQLEPAAVLDLLLADETNPRSVAFQLAGIEQHLNQLPRDSTHPQLNVDLQQVLQLRTTVQLTDLTAMCIPTRGQRARLKALLEQVTEQLELISKLVTQMFFNHAAVSPHLLNSEKAEP